MERNTAIHSREVRRVIGSSLKSIEELPYGALKLTITVSHDAEILMAIPRHGSQVELEPKKYRT